MKINQLIKQELLRMESLSQQMNNISEMMLVSPKNDIAILNKFMSLLKQYKGNPLILKKLGDFLSLVEDKKLVETYELVDVLSLHEALVKFNQMDLETQLELYYFLYNVMGDKASADNELAKLKNLIESEFLRVEKYR
jgi:hypothetical protein